MFTHRSRINIIINNHCFSIELAKNEITQSSDKLREKNAVRDGKLSTS